MDNSPRYRLNGRVSGLQRKALDAITMLDAGTEHVLGVVQNGTVVPTWYIFVITIAILLPAAVIHSSPGIHPPTRHRPRPF
ncbi:hypothetical protein K488DRAFT_89673 [Vararia minispora EC-137]|uniref:Uncharacterized protein n=1 Tax=Vararia minispora EC-137 TaxID=1314806 RepID=A0ACB8Q9M8_9AGAM|nr:hypothetical protein K488DRAFT_89673 [Vararia minispora EC-137]